MHREIVQMCLLQCLADVNNCRDCAVVLDIHSLFSILKMDNSVFLTPSSKVFTLKA